MESSNGAGTMSYKEADRLGLIRAVVEKRLRQREAAWSRGSPGQAAGTTVSVGRTGGAGVGSSRQAAEQCHRRGGPAGDAGPGSEALCGFRPDIGVREAGGGARLPGVGGDVAPVDDGRGFVAFEVAARGAGPPEAPASRERGGLGPDRRFAARLVRGPGSAVHVDRVRGRRDDAVAGDGIFPLGDDRGVHEDDAGASGVNAEVIFPSCAEAKSPHLL